MNPRTASVWRKLAACATIAVATLLLIGLGVTLAQGGGPTVDWWVIAGGGAPSSGGNVTLNDTLGQPFVGAAGGGSVSLRDGYWPRCVAAPAVAPVVAIARSGADAALTWESLIPNTQYQIWVSTNPYFDPDNPGGVTPVITASTTYTDTGAAASLVNHCYVVRGLNACAAASTNSGRTGEFTFGLTAGMP
jgi:hypothetical protein